MSGRAMNREGGVWRPGAGKAVVVSRGALSGSLARGPRVGENGEVLIQCARCGRGITARAASGLCKGCSIVIPPAEVKKDWQARARCRNVSPDVMQPEEATRDEVKRATAVCIGCPVIDECRSTAVGQVEAYGVWAGIWWGADPTWLTLRTCARDGCDVSFKTAEAGEGARLFCTSRCRVAAHRASKVSA